MNTIVGFFSSDKQESDVGVDQFIRKHFPSVNTKVYDLSFITQQISKSML